MEIHAYDEMYVPLAQRILGDAIDYAVYSCEMDADAFLEMFIASGYAYQFENGNPSYVAGINGCELVKKVIFKSGLEVPDIPDEMYLDKSPEYWAGWALAYYQWHTAKTFNTIHHAVSVQELLYLYITLHEADIMKFIDVMDDRLKKFYTETNLKRIRTFAGLTQRELAIRSGVPLRQIQLFEQRRRDINKTQAINLFRLGKVLGCRSDELLEI